MTGTIWNVGSNVNNLPVHVGDRIGWTLQYDRSLSNMPGTSSPFSATVTYAAATSPLFNFVDLTTHTPLPAPPNGPSSVNFGYPSHVLTWNPGSPNMGSPQFTATASWMRSSDGLFASATLGLQINSNNVVLPAKDLAHLQLSSIPFDIRSLAYEYQLPPSSMPALEFWVKADPLSVSISSTPEPSSLILSSLGALGLIGSCVFSQRRRATVLARSALSRCA
jgi:hypothetical protein